MSTLSSMATATPILNETQALRDLYRRIAAVEQVYARVDRECIAVSVVSSSREPEVLSEIFRAEGAVMDHFPGTQFCFDVIFKDGRSMQEIGVPGGTLLFMR